MNAAGRTSAGALCGDGYFETASVALAIAS